MARFAAGLLAGLLATLLAAPAAAQRVFEFDDHPIEGDLVRPGPARAAPAPPRPRAGTLDAEIAVLRAVVRAGRADAQLRIRLARLLADRSSRHQLESLRALDLEYAARGVGDAVESERMQRLSSRERDTARVDRALAIDAIERVARGEGTRDQVITALKLRMSLLAEDDRAADAANVAREVIHLCARCLEAADAHLLLGDQAFDQAALELAREHYAAVLAVDGVHPDLRAYALYKIAWVETNLGDFRTALGAFVRCREIAATGAEPRGALARAAANDLVWTLARLRVDSAEAVRTIRALAAGDDESEVLARRYVGQLVDDGRSSDVDGFLGAWRARP